jgi:hypothetical protein
MTEADEIAHGGLPTAGVVDMETARAVVARYCGTPAEFGYQMTDNVAWALLQRAERSA